jgi:hypothetical protein
MILIIEGATWKVENKIKINLKDRGWERVNTLSSGSGQKQMAGPYEHGNELDMVEKPTNIQGVSGGKVNILGDGYMDYSE